MFFEQFSMYIHIGYFFDLKVMLHMLFSFIIHCGNQGKNEFPRAIPNKFFLRHVFFSRNIKGAMDLIDGKSVLHSHSLRVNIDTDQAGMISFTGKL